MTSRALRRRALATAAVLLVLACAKAGAPPPAVASEDEEPLAPSLFFGTPDSETRKQIDDVIDGGFGDVSKAPRVRLALLSRWGLWSVPSLVTRVETASNVPHAWNSALAIGTLRREIGPSSLLWPAVRPLTKRLDASSAEPYERAFAALALGTFHGPALVRRSSASREGSEEGATAARKALIEAEDSLVRALEDSHMEIATAAALALGKWGGTSAAGKVGRALRTASLASQVTAREALLLALGLLPMAEADAQPMLTATLKSEEAPIRASAALSIACWAVVEAAGEWGGPPPPPGAVLARAKAFEAMLDPVQNVQIRLVDRDGAEATFARGMLARITGRLETWEELYTLATLPSTDPKTAVAAAQALLFAPAQSPVRLRMAEYAGKQDVGRSTKEPVLAAFLVVAAGDGTPAGVRAARSFLKNKGRQPTGRIEYDVRYHAAIGLVRALLAGRLAGEARAEAAEALLEAARGHLPAAPPGGRAFRDELEDLVKPVRDTLATTGALAPTAEETLRRAFVDPDAMLARDPVDVALARLDAMVRTLFGLDSLPKAASGSGPNRVPTKSDQPQRFLLGWMEEQPYFTRLDFRAGRGRVEAPAPLAAVDPATEIRRPK